MTNETFRPLLRSQAEVAGFWMTTCHPLGWRRRELWIVLVDAQGEPFPSVRQIADVPPEPDQQAVSRLVSGCRALLDEFDPGGRVAMLLCRPGDGWVTASDRAWVSALTAAAREAVLELEVVHVASDAAITPVPFDAVA